MANLQKTIEIIAASRELSELCWRMAVETAHTEAAAEKFEQDGQDCDDHYSHALDISVRADALDSSVQSDDYRIDCEELDTLIGQEFWNEWCSGERPPIEAD